MFGKDEGTETRLRKAFWEAMDDSPFIMLGLKGVEDDRTRPMSAQIDIPKGGEKYAGGPIYFFASKTDGVGADIGSSARAVATFASKDHKLFAHIHGTLVPSQDREVIERMWNPIVASWYKDGKDDPDLALIRFDADSANIWKAESGATLKAAAMKALFDVDPGKEHERDNRADVEL